MRKIQFLIVFVVATLSIACENETFDEVIYTQENDENNEDDNDGEIIIDGNI